MLGLVWFGFSVLFIVIWREGRGGRGDFFWFFGFGGGGGTEYAWIRYGAGRYMEGPGIRDQGSGRG